MASHDRANKKSARAFSRPVHAGLCDQCGGVLTGKRRGSPQRFCQEACRRAFGTAARQAGEQLLRRRRRRAARGISGGVKRKTPAGKRVALLVALGALPLFLLGPRARLRVPGQVEPLILPDPAAGTGLPE